MKIEVGGIDAFNVTIDKFNDDVIDMINKEIAGAAFRTVAIAKTRLQPLPEDDADPEFVADLTAVRASINFEHDKENLTATVFAGNTAKDHFAAYLEFGTGEFAAKQVKTLPFEYEAVAWQFFVNGKGTMRAHPFFFHTYIQEGKRFVDRAKGWKPGK